MALGDPVLAEPRPRWARQRHHLLLHRWIPPLRVVVGREVRARSAVSDRAGGPAAVYLGRPALAVSVGPARGIRRTDADAEADEDAQALDAPGAPRFSSGSGSSPRRRPRGARRGAGP